MLKETRWKEKYIVLLTYLQLLLLLLLKKIPSGSDIVKKVDYNAKILEMENKYFTTSDYSNFARNTLDAK